MPTGQAPSGSTERRAFVIGPPGGTSVLRAVRVDVGSESLTFSDPGSGTSPRRTVITASENPITVPGTFTFRAIVPARSEWSTCLMVETWVGGSQIVPRHRCGEPVDASPPARRMREWRRSNPRITVSEPVLATTMQASARDIGALRIEDPEQPGCPVVAAGAPWFMALKRRRGGRHRRLTF